MFEMDRGDVAQLRVIADLYEVAGRDAPRRAGAVLGAAADEISGSVASEHQTRGWGETSRVWARRGSGGPYDPRAFVFMSGGAAWLEDHPDWPQPTLTPAFDRAQAGIEDAIGGAAEGLL